MKKLQTHKAVIFIVLLVQTLSLSAQHEQEQKLIDLLTSGQYFEAKKFYNEVEKDSVFDAFFRLYYKYEMAKMQYENDSAAIYLEGLLMDGDKYWGPLQPYFYNDLLELHITKLQDYPKALLTCESIKKFLEKNIFNIDKETVKTFSNHVVEKEQQILKREKFPTIKITRNSTGSNVLNIKDADKSLFFDAIYNNNDTVRTMFDNGLSFHCVMKEDLANKIGVKRLNIIDNDSSIILNDTILPMEEGILDSIEIANLKLYNIPVVIYKYDPTSNIPESYLKGNSKRKKSKEYLSQSMEVIMGYPVMFLIGKILIDFDNSILSFPNVSLISHNTLNAPNLFIHKNKLFTPLSINDIPFTAHLDLGSDSYIQIHSSFYEKNKSRIPIKHLKNRKKLNILMFHKAWLDIPYEIAKNPQIRFNDKNIPVKKKQLVEIYSLPDQVMPEVYDGDIGYPFLRDLGKKLLLDFDNMRLEIIE